MVQKTYRFYTREQEEACGTVTIKVMALSRGKGNTVLPPQAYEAAGISFDFSDSTLHDVSSFIEQQLEIHDAF